jgi:microfibrillar-associated protein 1
VADPVIISLSTIKDEETDEPEQHLPSTSRHRHRHHSSSSDSGNEDADRRSKRNEEEDDDDVARRHERIRRIKAETEHEEELLAHQAGDENNDDDDEEDESDEDEEYESEDDVLPRLKPVFVRKDDRVTVKERELEERKEKERGEAAKREAEERRMQALQIIEDDRRREEREKQEKADDEALAAAIDAICTDDENEGADGSEVGYEMWKLRELKRVKRDKDENEEHVRMEEEKERMRNMTEEERQLELEKNPKIITNAAEKGKYKFMQKYYHRGAFYLDSEDEVFKRNVAEPTLEDHFDKSVLPKVMQVKNFGRAGRTKYTHLVDQDTTAHDGPWAAETSLTQKFKTSQGGGFKPVFERPSKKRKT